MKFVVYGLQNGLNAQVLWFGNFILKPYKDPTMKLLIVMVLVPCFLNGFQVINLYKNSFGFMTIF